MKILRVISSMDPVHGGPCQGIRNVVPELEKLGVRNEIVSLDDPGASFLGNDNLIIHPLGKPNNSYLYTACLQKWLFENFGKYDMVIVHGLWQYTSVGTVKAWLRYKRKNGRNFPKLYVMPHGMLDPWFQKAPERKLKAIRNYFFWHLFEKYVVNHADGVLFTCRQELLLARTTFSDYRPKAELNVSYGIQAPPEYSDNMLAALKERISINNPYILFLSRIDPKKGIDLLIAAYLQLYNENKSGALPELMVVGPGMETAYGKFIKSLAGDNTPIHFVGMLQGEAKWGAIYGCEAFILPSHQENFGIAVVEAMACGKPVLISNQVNIWTEIVDGGGGLVEDNTVTGTFKLLKEFVTLNEVEKGDMGNKSFDIYRRKFKNEEAAKQMKEELSKHTV